jgi:hypothetical protein
MVLAAIELPIGIVERDPRFVDGIVDLEPSKDFSFTLPVRWWKAEARMRRGSKDASPDITGERLQQSLIEKLLLVPMQS